KAHAEAAAATVRRMHEHAKWEDPHTGQVLRADNQDWLAWTHNTFVYALVRACDEFGVNLSRVDRDRFVVEQHKAAELIGIEDHANMPKSMAELDEYINAQQGWL